MAQLPSSSKQLLLLLLLSTCATLAGASKWAARATSLPLGRRLSDGRDVWTRGPSFIQLLRWLQLRLLLRLLLLLVLLPASVLAAASNLWCAYDADRSRLDRRELLSLRPLLLLCLALTLVAPQAGCHLRLTWRQQGARNWRQPARLELLLVSVANH